MDMKYQPNLDLKAIAVSNALSHQRGIQFLDVDDITFEQFKKIQFFKNVISATFPLDCIVFNSNTNTGKGLHFVSFIVIPRAVALTRAKFAVKMLQQDYIVGANECPSELCLRTSPKFKREGDVRVEVKPAPQFCAEWRYVQGLVSQKHLSLYKKFCGLPQEIYDKYMINPAIFETLSLYRYYNEPEIEIIKKKIKLSDFF